MCKFLSSHLREDGDGFQLTAQGADFAPVLNGSHLPRDVGEHVGDEWSIGGHGSTGKNREGASLALSAIVKHSTRRSSEASRWCFPVTENAC